MQHKLHDFAIGKISRLIIEAPPGHGKSEDTSRNLPAYVFGINPDSRIIACSYTQDLAASMNRDVQRVMETEAYRTAFPAVSLGAENIRTLAGKPRRNTAVFDIPARRGYYKAAGVGVGIGGWRFDRGIIDDPIKDREEANSPAHRERVWRWFTSVFCKRQAKDAGILITSTRWHDDDLVGRIKKKMLIGEIEPYEVLTLPALAEPGQVRHSDDPRKDGEALWPWLRNAEQLEMMKRTEPRDFAALEQQNPRGEGNTEWPRQYFERPDFFYINDPLRADRHCRILYYDGAGDPKARKGDWHAVSILTVTTNGHLWFENRLRRCSQDQAAVWLCEILEGEPIDAAGVEANFGGEIMIPLIGYVARDRKRPDLVGKWKGVHNSLTKESRIRRLGPYLMNELLHVKDDAGGRETLRQAEQFPFCDHDDALDAMDGAVQLASHLLAA